MPVRSTGQADAAGRDKPSSFIAPQFVKPYVKENKNDTNDAEANCESVGEPNMRFVPIKTIEQQNIQALHRIGTELVRQRTAKVNQSRSLLGEYGIVTRQGVAVLRKALPDILEDAENGLMSDFRAMLTGCEKTWSIWMNGWQRWSRPSRHWQIPMRTRGICSSCAGLGRSRRPHLSPRSAMATYSNAGEMPRPGWGGCPANTASATRQSAGASANAGTSTCAPCWSRVPGRRS